MSILQGTSGQRQQSARVTKIMNETVLNMLHKQRGTVSVNGCHRYFMPPPPNDIKIYILTLSAASNITVTQSVWRLIQGLGICGLQFI